MAGSDVLVRVGNAKAATPTWNPRIAAVGMAVVASLGTPSILSGSGVAVAGVSATASLGTPTIVVSSNVAPTGFQVTASSGALTFTGADVLVRVGNAVIASPTFTDTSSGSHEETPTGFSVTASLGTPTPSVINGANPIGFQVVGSASGAGVDIDAAVGVDGFGLTAGLGTPSADVVEGNNSVFPSGLESTAGLGTPVVGVAVTPAGFQMESDQGLTNSPFSISELNWWPPLPDGLLDWPPGGPIWNNSKNPSIDLDPAVVVSNTQTPSGQSVTVSMGTPSVDVSSSQQDALVPVTGFAVTVGFGDLGTTWPVTHDATGFGMTADMGTATVSVDDTESPAGFSVTAGLGTPQVKVDGSVAPTGFSVTADVGSPITAGNITVRPTGFRVVTSLGSITIGGPDLSRPLLCADRSHAVYDLRDDSGPRYEVTPLAHPRYWIQEVTMARTIYLNNDDEFEFYVTRRNTSTGLVEPAAGIAGMTCLISATKSGAAIDASLEVSATERATNPGYYYGVMQGSDFATYLASYAGRTVFRVLKNGTDIVAYTRVTVRASRPIV